MAGEIEARLEELGIVVPAPSGPLADYVPFVQTGNTLYVSGQLPLIGERVITGQLTEADHVEGTPPPESQLAEAVEAARICAVNMLAHVKAATGDLDRVRRVVKLTGYVNCDGSFIQQPQVVNGASALMGAVFGDAGRHARAAVGVSSLPRGAVVEVEGIFEIA